MASREAARSRLFAFIFEFPPCNPRLLKMPKGRAMTYLILSGPAGDQCEYYAETILCEVSLMIFVMLRWLFVFSWMPLLFAQADEIRSVLSDSAEAAARDEDRNKSHVIFGVVRAGSASFQEYSD
jgi:hypothetical protein